MVKQKFGMAQKKRTPKGHSLLQGIKGLGLKKGYCFSALYADAIVA